MSFNEGQRTLHVEMAVGASVTPGAIKEGADAMQRLIGNLLGPTLKGTRFVEDQRVIEFTVDATDIVEARNVIAAAVKTASAGLQPKTA